MRSVSVRSVAMLFGAAALMLAGAAEARGFRALYQFAGGNDGNGSVDKLLLDNAGNLYGVTTPNDSVLGTVFMLSPGGTETVLHGFQLQAGQASIPTGGVIMDAQGNLYGEAINGGLFLCPEINPLDPDCGGVYKLATDGTLTTIYNFQGGSDGGGPLGGLLIDGAGNLYGTTKFGGSGNFCSGGCGTVFKIAPDGTKTVLYNFAGQSDGARPTGSLIADAQNNLYGTTPLGGHDHGTVFRLAPDGTETQLYAFNGTDGDQPSGGLAMDKAGNLYGTTPTGGNLGGSYGEVYKLATDGTLTVLHAFTNAGGDGFYPAGGVAIDKRGNVYGTTAQGGEGCRSYGCGTAFKIASDGTYSQLHRFRGTVAHNPFAGLVMDNAGNLYGGALGPYGDPAHLGMLFAVRK
jgi:uncharacterized repeat protein (TIGR03803 family)